MSMGQYLEPCQPQSKKTHTSCSTQHEYGTVPDTLSQQGGPGQTLARPGSVTWWQYGVPAQTFCLPPQPAVQLSFVDSFIHSLKIAFNQSIFISFIPAATACSTALIY